MHASVIIYDTIFKADVFWLLVGCKWEVGGGIPLEQGIYLREREATNLIHDIVRYMVAAPILCFGRKSA